MARAGRVGLGLGDRLILLVAWIATCGLVYLLGFYTGKGTQERRLGLEERVVRLPVTSKPPPEGQRPKAENEFVFYDKLMGERPGRETATAASAPEKTVAAEPAPKPAAAPVAVPRPVAPPTPPAPARATTRTPEKAAPAVVAPPVAVASRPASAPIPAPPGAPKTLDAAPRTAADGGWTVLANPTRSRDEADGLLRQLRTRGYDATLVRVLRDGDTWYRVQVGRFASADQASEVMHRLRDREGVTHAFVASE